MSNHFITLQNVSTIRIDIKLELQCWLIRTVYSVLPKKKKKMVSTVDDSITELNLQSCLEVQLSWPQEMSTSQTWMKFWSKWQRG